MPPIVMASPPDGLLVVRRAAAISLECKANGNPTPTVSWVKMPASAGAAIAAAAGRKGHRHIRREGVR